MNEIINNNSKQLACIFENSTANFERLQKNHGQDTYFSIKTLKRNHTQMFYFNIYKLALYNALFMYVIHFELRIFINFQ